MNRNFLRSFYFPLFESSFLDEPKKDYRLDEKDGEILLEVDLPGVDKKDVSVELEDDLIKIKSKRGDAESEMVFRIKKELSKNEIKAEMSLGVLKLKMKEKEKQVAKIVVE